MKQIFLNLKATRILILGVLCTTIFSFALMPGGEGFEIYLNNRLLTQRFGKDVNTIQTLQLDPSYANEQLTVKYYHCGRVGKNRSITIRDAQNRVLKQWNFADGSAASTGMNCNMNDILELGKKTSTLNLYYSSTELPGGRLLVSLTIDKSVAARAHAK